jgi:murein DD-endopeptidase MepM/ murein hydrolase activator NlpD
LPAEKYSIIIIPEGHRRTHRFQVNRNWARLLAAVLVVAVLMVSGLVYHCCRIQMDRAELQRLRTERRSYQQELRQVVGQLETLRKDMVVLASNDTKVRLMTKLAKPVENVSVGIGGPVETDPVRELSGVQRQIDDIRQDIDLRRESLEELQGALNDQRSLFAARPKGKPAKGWVTSGFGVRKSPFSDGNKMHCGLDIAARTGTPVLAPADGVVKRVGTAPDYGKMVVIDHGYGYQTLYAHNSKLFVKVGQRVKRGDQIAAIGNTGRSTGSHLHYEVHLNGVPIDPRKFL